MEIIILPIIAYLLALGTSLMMYGPRGVSYVNRLARRLLSALVKLIGNLILELARVIRG